jgi:tRNA-dihydrouridine synthase
VKVRAGWDYSLFAAPDLAKAFVGVGAKAITLHARFAKQGFEGEADWRLIGALRQAIDVPLFGNGDIKTAADARRMMNSTGCDGVMVGRAAISNPWALQRIVAEFTDAKPLEQPSLSDRIDVALEHLRLAIDFERETSDDDDWELRACRSLRGQIPLYIKSSYGASHIRGALTKCNSYAEFEEILRTFETQIIHHAETNQLAHSP